MHYSGTSLNGHLPIAATLLMQPLDRVLIEAPLENVEHCGAEPEQPDRISMSDVTYSKFSVQCKHNGTLTNSTPMDLLNVTDSSLCTPIVYQA